MLIFLIGFMGSGKTHIGRELARLLDFQFADLDGMLEIQQRKTIAQLFESEGETSFRQHEAECLRGMADYKKHVVAVGGGTPCFYQNMAWMNGQGLTIYLQASAELLASRLENEAGDRPLLQGKNGAALLDFIKNTLATRAEFYEQAHLSLEILEHKQEVAQELAAFLSRFIKK